MSKENEVECFTVHVYPRIRVTLKGIKAQNHAAAAEIAAAALIGDDFASLVERSTVVQLEGDVTIASIGSPEDYDHQFLVDREGEVVESEEILSQADQKALRADLAKKFLAELYDRCEFWSGLDAGVLANVLYLQQAILNDGTIFLSRNDSDDVDKDGRATRELLRGLPSTAEWMKFVTDEE
jgi:hypothetical protein